MKRLSLIAIFVISRDDRVEFFIPLSQLNLVAINVASGHALLGIANLTGVRFRHLSRNQAKSCASDCANWFIAGARSWRCWLEKMSWRGMWNRSAVGSWMDTKRRMRLMGILRPVVAALMRAMLDVRHDLFLCSVLGSRIVGDHYPRRLPCLSTACALGVWLPLALRRLCTRISSPNPS
jgi:hypothetical protein